MQNYHRKNELPNKVKARLYHTLSVMYRTGIHIAQSVNEQYKIEEKPQLKKTLRNIYLGTSAGKPLSEIFEREIGKFSKSDIALIRAAENIGKLPIMLKDLSIHHEQITGFKSRLTQGMIYPAILFSIACFISAAPVLFSSGLLPFLWSATYPLMLLFVILLLGYKTAKYIYKKAGDNETYSRILTSIPVAGGMIKKFDLYRFAKTMALAQSSGIHLFKSLELAGGGVKTYLIKKQINEASTSMEKEGLTLAQAFAKSETIGPILASSLAIGETSGTLEESLDKFSQYAHDELKHELILFRRVSVIIAYAASVLFVISRIILSLGNIFGPLKS